VPHGISRLVTGRTPASHAQLRLSRLLRSVADGRHDLGLAGWRPRGLRRWITFPGDDFRRRKSFIDRSPTARFGRSISTPSVAIELDQPLVADPEVMRDLVEHDVPDLAA
jgi:hypothetical protein